MIWEHGVSIFDADPDEVDRIMRQDPGVKAGLFSYEIHATQTFPESTLASAVAAAASPASPAPTTRTGSSSSFSVRIPLQILQGVIS